MVACYLLPLQVGQHQHQEVHRHGSRTAPCVGLGLIWVQIWAGCWALQQYTAVYIILYLGFNCSGYMYPKYPHLQLLQLLTSSLKKNQNGLLVHHHAAEMIYKIQFHLI